MRDDEVRALARGVALNLGLRAEDDGYDVTRLVGNAGIKLTMRRVWNAKTRVSIHGGLPSGAPYDQRCKPMSITVAISRGAAVIAREVERRLLPIYLPALTASQSYIVDQQAERSDRVELATVLANVLGTKVTDRGDEVWVYSHDSEHGSMDIRLSHGRYNHVEIRNVSAEVLVALAEVVRTSLQTAVPGDAA